MNQYSFELKLWDKLNNLKFEDPPLKGNLKIEEVLVETFNNRHTTFKEIAAFNDDFTNDYYHQQR